MLNWSTNAEEICCEIRKCVSQIKFILKTKDDFELLEEWILHHLKIAGSGNLIIFDNFSTNSFVYDMYSKYEKVIKVFRWDINHNLIHNVDYCPNLYTALRDSSNYYSFLDTDERAYWTNGNQFYSNENFLKSLENIGNDIVFPGLWLINHPGSSNIFNISDISTRFKSELNGGKPLISSKAEIKSFINHNVQLLQNNSHLKIQGGYIVCHLLHIHQARRARLNVSKCIAHGFCKSEDEIEQIISSDNFNQLSGSFRTYVQEIVDSRNIKLVNISEPQHGQLQVQSCGLLKFGSIDAKTALELFVNNSSFGDWNVCQ